MAVVGFPTRGAQSVSKCHFRLPGATSSLSSWDLLVICLVAVLFVLVRLTGLPESAEITGAVSHDSSYLLIVAENLMSGRGFVNDAHWLVFLNPPHLPMQFHNGNPLYPFMIAALMARGVEGATGGLIISAAASGVLFVGIAIVARCFNQHLLTSLAIGFLTVLFPPLFSDSLRVLTDHLATSFAVVGVAAILATPHRESYAGVVLSGFFLGLSWLTRSQIILALPFIIGMLIILYPGRGGVRRSSVFALIFTLTICPWLIHQKINTGAYSSGDSSYYLVQDLEANAHFEGEVERYWHSTSTPRSVLEIAEQDPPAFLSHVAQGVARVLRTLLGFWTGHSFVSLGVLLVLSVIIGGMTVRRAPISSLVLLAILFFYGSALVGVFSIRGASAEMRYFATLSCWLPCVLLLGASRLRWPVRCLTWGYFIILCATQDLPLLSKVFAIHPERANYWIQTEIVRQEIGTEKPVIVGSHPYFFTRATGIPSLSMPESSDDFLLSYMQKYGAEFVVITPTERTFWRPKWEAQVPRFLSGVASASQFLVYRRTGALHD